MVLVCLQRPLKCDRQLLVDLMNGCLNFNLDAPLGSFDTILEQRDKAVSSDTEKNKTIHFDIFCFLKISKCYRAGKIKILKLYSLNYTLFNSNWSLLHRRKSNYSMLPRVDGTGRVYMMVKVKGECGFY